MRLENKKYLFNELAQKKSEKVLFHKTISPYICTPKAKER
jgi:hypothetical protein